LRKGIVPKDRHSAFYPGAFPRVFSRPDFLEQQWESGWCRAVSDPKYNDEPSRNVHLSVVSARLEWFSAHDHHPRFIQRAKTDVKKDSTGFLFGTLRRLGQAKI